MLAEADAGDHLQMQVISPATCNLQNAVLDQNLLQLAF
jgi:hypothetical protein